MAVIAGVILTLTLVLNLEYFDDTIRAVGDLVYTTACLSWPPSPNISACRGSVTNGLSCTLSPIHARPKVTGC